MSVILVNKYDSNTISCLRWHVIG